MIKVKLSIGAMLAICALGSAAVPAVAGAESDGQPAGLILSGKVSEVEFKGEGSRVSVLSVLGNGKSLEDEGEVEKVKQGAVVGSVTGCKELEKKPLDSNECEGLLTFRGIHIVGTTTLCRSETLAGVKDALGIGLVKLLVRAAAEKSTGGVLEPLAIAKVLSIDGTSPLEITCGVVKVRVSGRIPCLGLPGLTETEKGELVCATTKTAGDQETGICEETAASCKELKEDPFLAGFSETEKTDSAMLMTIKGTSNKPGFGDD